MNKLIGVCLILAPLVWLAVEGVRCFGWRKTVVSFVTAGFFAASVFVGVWLVVK